MNPTAILFDLDGTLTDPRDGITRCIEHALRALDETPPSHAEMHSWIGPPLQESFGRFLNGDAERVGRAVQCYRDRFDEHGWRENRLIPLMADIVKSLSQQGIHLYIATSKPRVFAQRIAEHFGIAPWFHGVYGSELDGRLANKADLIRHILQTENLVPDEVAMVGDRRHDVEGARKVGVVCVGVLWGFGCREELVRAGAGRIVAHPGELLETFTSARIPPPHSITQGRAHVAPVL